MLLPWTIMKLPIIYFDTNCILCNRSVQFLLWIDRKEVFHFSDFHSNSFKQNFKDSLSSEKLKSVVLVYKKNIYYKSDAVLESFRILGGLWKTFLIFKIIPLSLRDMLYDFIARNRYAWFGTTEKCLIPNEKFKDRFLH